LPVPAFWFARPLEVGSPAPDFTLRDENGDTVSLHALRGKNVVLVFYPGDDTPVCRKQLCEFRDQWEAARSADTLVFGINPQKPASHRAFREKFSFPFPLLVDEGQRVAAVYRSSGWFVRRTVYLIGKDGRIRYARRGKPPVDEVLASAE
jgi:peroxiredoxin Q/BCP